METYLYNCCKNLLDFFDCLDLSCFKKYYKKDKCDLDHIYDVDHVDGGHLNDADDEKSDDSDYDDWVIKNRYYKT